MSAVGRVHVRCAATPEEEARALRLRDRLVRTARVHLPDALEQAFAGGIERRVYAERLAVRLDFDPDDYDDVTTALLWAGSVRRAVDAELASGSATLGVVAFADGREYFGAAALEYAERGELSWVFEELACGAGSPAAAAFLAAFDTPARVTALAAALTRRVEAAAALWRRLTASERGAVLEALAGARAWGDWSVEPDASANGGAESGSAGHESSVERGSGDAAGSSTAGRAADPVSGGGRTPGGAEGRSAFPGATAALDDWLAALAQCARSGAVGVRHAGGRRAKPPAASADRVLSAPGRSREDGDLPASGDPSPVPRASEPVAAEPDARREPAAAPETWWSSVGGLVLLYPWLADLLAEEVEPGRELAYRSWALAAVLSPAAEEPLLADPLVRVLAGADPAAPYRPLLRPPGEEESARRGEGVLRSFAAALPGFERSSAPYLRQFLLVRGALVARLPGDEGYGVRLEPAPLDPILVRLPYPLTAFRFAWSETVHIELRDARG